MPSYISEHPSMTYVSERLRRQVYDRAQGRCEYCLIHEDDGTYAHEPDHVIAEKHGGLTILENLALACFLCNRFKGSDLSSIDPMTNQVALLYHPRKQNWRRHFRLNAGRIEPLTTSGRATENLLQLNTQNNIRERLRLMEIQHYPTK